MQILKKIEFGQNSPIENEIFREIIEQQSKKNAE